MNAATMSDNKARLTRNIIAGLPGAEEGYTLDQFRQHLARYKDIDKAALRTFWPCPSSAV